MTTRNRSRSARAGALPSAFLSRAALGYVKPGSYEELRAVLSSGTVRLPKKLQQVANYLWQGPGDVALGTVTSIAEAAGVQPSSLVRFAQALGYTGFTDLQDVFKAYARATWVEERIRPGLADRVCDEELFLEGMISASAASLANLREAPQIAELQAATDMLASADVIYVVGSKRAFSVAGYLSLALLKLGVRNILIDNVGATAFEQMGCVTANDAVLAISFAPYNSVTPDLAALAAQRGAKVASITDSPDSPLVPLSKICIEISEGEFGGFKSVAAAVAVAMAIALGVAKRRGAPSG
jgi:DNA-binding MurR/RpiR family transcriptional regulator